MTSILSSGVQWTKPPGLLCHVCGREYGTTSLAIHLPQCIALFKSRQLLLPKSQRQPLPKGNFSLAQVQDLKIDSKNHEQILEFNSQQAQSFKEESLVPCEHCGRRFLVEKLCVHQRSCTADKPAAAIGSHRLKSQTLLRPKTSASSSSSAEFPALSSSSSPSAQIEVKTSDLPIKPASNLNFASDVSFYSEASSSSSSEDTSMPLRPCMYCSRSFAIDRVEKHEVVCAHNTASHANTTNIKAAAKLPSRPKTATAPSSSSSSSTASSNNNWKSKHAEFQAALQYSKQFAAAQAAGVNLADLPPPPRSENPDFKQCPHCLRRFNPTAAERHIPACANTINKPKPPPQLRQTAIISSSISSSAPAVRPKTAAVASFGTRTSFSNTLPTPLLTPSSRPSASFAQLSQTATLGEIKNKNKTALRSPGSRQAAAAFPASSVTESNAQIAMMQKQIEALTQSVQALTNQLATKQAQ